MVSRIETTPRGINTFICSQCMSASFANEGPKMLLVLRDVNAYIQLGGGHFALL